ncbi:AAA family ATPase [Pontibacillus halophilus]|uniref:AAA family ATPase n=1 Tax=Pontibacillus halophilus TaxID=516704 RepID=UPI00042082D7|nr:AAA family ATPase [Pontibacillus halophilus]
MNIGVVSRNVAYKELFEKEESVNLSIMIAHIDKEKPNSNVPLTGLLIDGETVNYNELATVREIFPDIPIFYKLHGVKSHELTKTINRLCAAQKIQSINELYTIEQVVLEVMQYLNEKEGFSSNKVIAFFGTHSGVGVSTTSLNIAEAVSSKVKDRVLLLSLNAWDPADYFTEYKGKYLNDLKVDLKTETLNTAKLHEALYQHNGFYHLAGNRDIKLQRFYTNKEIAHLIDVAKESFDLILIDGGTHFDSALATQAFVHSNLRFIVTSQDDKGYRGYFPHVYQQLLEPVGSVKSDFMLIINRYQPNMSLISEKDLEEELEIKRIATVPSLDVLGPIAIRQKKLLYNISTDPNYVKSIDQVANTVIAEANLTENNHENGSINRERGLLRGFFKKEKVR